MELIAVLSPLLGAFIAGVFGRQIGDRAANVVTCALMLAAAVCSVILFRDVALMKEPRTIELFTWIASGKLKVSWALRFDQLAAVMVLVVNLVSCAVHVYSVGYMSHDDARARFMSYLSLFTFAMLMLVTANNFVQLFFGWEGVGLMSYLLIGFWNKKESANNAAIKAFVMNRIGDFGLALGIMAVFFVFGSLNYDDVFSGAAAMKDVDAIFLGHEFNVLNLICALLFVGAIGKSAQLGLHTWLPDAMEGPTPVSALIHAATMVTAGVFLVARMSPLYEHADAVRAFITVLGALTAFVAATIALTQFDIKRVIAYSTMSQLGYMFFALGVSAYGAAMFHLFTHAFFKALLFLGAGSVIHAMSGEQDMRKMGGIYKLIPSTYILMWIGNLALAGVPFFAGYYSKDMILEAAFAAGSNVGHFAYWIGIAAAFMTAFYSWRLLFLTFHGTPRADKHTMDHVHESPAVMMIPLYFLAIGAVGAGFWGYQFFVGEGRANFWGGSIFVNPDHDTIEHAHHVAGWVKLLPTYVAAAGILLAGIMYMWATGLPGKIAGAFKFVHGFLYHKWYFDELYDKIGIVPAFFIGNKLWKIGDGKIIDGLGPDGIAAAISGASVKTGKMQTGYVYHYAFAMLVGVVVFMTAYIFLMQR
ncbi:MAG: NADH-quinone oxidoreductase subunit L [Alphaproteobacteria bacterium]|nr:NADH-quinone oxidoreductase subunit L [Alphaproteobacteria bacterium]